MRATSPLRKLPGTLSLAALMAVFAAGAGCGPTSTVLRVVNSEFDADGADGAGGGVGAEDSGQPDIDIGGGGADGGGETGTGGNPGLAGSGGMAMGGAGGSAVDARPDMMVVPETNPVPDMAVDRGMDAAVNRKALLVVGNTPTLTAGDMKVRAIAMANGFDVVLISDEDAYANNSGVGVIVLAPSCSSATLAGRFKATPTPVVVMEDHVFDDMNLTGPTDTDYAGNPTREISISSTNAGHPMAVGLPGGRPVVVNMGGPAGCCIVNWGVPAASATRIAFWGPSTNTPRVATFIYEAGANMVDNYPAPARRVALFAAEETLGTLSNDGARMVAAAILWAATPPR